MKKPAFILLLSCYSIYASAQRFILMRQHDNSTGRESDYTQLIAGQPIGVRTAAINLNFDEEIKSCRFIGISNDTLIVRRILALKDTIITRRKKDDSFLYIRDRAWEYGRTVAKHKRLITERYQMIITSDTLLVPLAEISHIRTYRRIVQWKDDVGMEFGALLPPVFAYMMYITVYPARSYAMRRWKFAKHMPSKKS